VRDKRAEERNQAWECLFCFLLVSSYFSGLRLFTAMYPRSSTTIRLVTFSCFFLSLTRGVSGLPKEIGWLFFSLSLLSGFSASKVRVFFLLVLGMVGMVGTFHSSLKRTGIGDCKWVPFDALHWIL
jgi:hypothetical protein